MLSELLNQRQAASNLRSDHARALQSHSPSGRIGGRTEVHNPASQLRPRTLKTRCLLCAFRRREQERTNENQVVNVSIPRHLYQRSVFIKPPRGEWTLRERFYQLVKFDLITKQGRLHRRSVT